MNANDPDRNNRSVPGNWPSAISPAMIVSGSLGLDEPRFGAQALYYLERRPQEAGRCVIVMAADDGARIDILPPPYSARSRVHEYGGGSYCVVAGDDGDTLYFVNDEDQDIYRAGPQGIERLTHAPHQRFADLAFDTNRQRLLAVGEQHGDGGISNTLVAIDISDGGLRTLHEGHDFYASPRPDPAGELLCWQSWDHPDMPWDGNRLWLATIDSDGGLTAARAVAGGDDIATFQPQWSPDRRLYYIADDDGWWHLYRCDPARPDSPAQQLTRGEKEFGQPQWVFAQSSYAFIDRHKLVCCYREQGQSRLAQLDLSAPDGEGVREPQVLAGDWQQFDALQARTQRFCFIGAASDRFPQLVLAEMAGAERREYRVIQHASRLPVSHDYFAPVRQLRFINRHGQAVYANYYPPTHPEHSLEGTAPPLIVICHGGPTGQSSPALDPKKLFWTSRGFALLDVDYSGSTGYGREYRNRLRGRWGQLDVEDCCDAALYAVAQGLADRERLIIRGSSAGGLTVLAALTFENVFSAGASYYGVSDLTALAGDTHKFEARYLDRLVGPWPEQRPLYEQRSPVNHSERLDCPVIFFQGLEDRVVPREQTEKMFAALAAKGLPVAVQYFAGEQHGFRQAETVMQCLENELAFYQWVLGLRDRDAIVFTGEIQRENMD